jgi:hypothetical protein
MWPVALRPGKKRPIGERWGLQQPTEASLRATFNRNPREGVGIRVGPEAGVIDLEIDGPEGERSLAALCGGELPETLGWTSARRPHRLFRWDERLAALFHKVTKKLSDVLPGLELRLGIGGQGQSACPPTVGTDGKAREWFGHDIAKLPEAAIEFLENALAGQRREELRTDRRSASSDPVAASFRKGLENEAGKVAMARDGDRHNTLLRAARTLGGYVQHGFLNENEIVAALGEAARRCGLPEEETSATIRDGLRNGLENPLPWPEKLAAPGGNGHVNIGTPRGSRPWAALRLHTLPIPPPFPLEVLPDPVRQFVSVASESIGCAPDFPAVQCLAVAGGMTGRTASLYLKPGYFASPSLYIACVGPVSDGKSPSLAATLMPVDSIDRELENEYDAALAAWQDAGVDEKGKPRKPVGTPPEPRRIDVENFTFEKLFMILKENPRGVLSRHDELSGLLAGLNQYRAGGKGNNRDNLLTASAGGKLTIDRKGWPGRRFPHERGTPSDPGGIA